MKAKLMGFKVIKVNAYKNPDFSGKMSISTNINISNVSRYKPDGVDVDALKIESSLKISYGELGEVEIGSQFYISGDEDFMSDFEKNFKNKNFEGSNVIMIMDVIMQKLSLRAFEIEEELNLPIHMKLPSIREKKGE